jgi:hypothetical protein
VARRMKVPHGKANPASSERRTRAPVVDVGAEPEGQFALRCSPGGISFHRPRARRSGGGTGASPASSAELYWLPFLMDGSALVSRFENIFPRAENEP